LHRKVKRRRSDFLHKTSRRLVNDNQALIFETLKIQGMMKNHHLAKASADAGWAEFMRQCEYKAKHEGRIFAKIGTFFPSSKTCSACGHKLKELSLATRRWTCPHCGAQHDRDLNASLNIKQEGIRMLKAAGLTVLRS
ncbi:MAG: transposase, partial [Sutterella wadsworthensis]|nr:transposase [Sutterella wadsworthensis]